MDHSEGSTWWTWIIGLNPIQFWWTPYPDRVCKIAKMHGKKRKSESYTLEEKGQLELGWPLLSTLKSTNGLKVYSKYAMDTRSIQSMQVGQECGESVLDRVLCLPHSADGGLVDICLRRYFVLCPAQEYSSLTSSMYVKRLEQRR